MLLVVVALAFAPAPRAAPRAAAARMCAGPLDGALSGYWSAKAKAARLEADRSLSELAELEEREHVYLEQMRAMSARLAAAPARPELTAAPDFAALEAQNGELAERMAIQQETLILATARLDELKAALEEQALVAERQLQSTSAYWLRVLNDERSGRAAAPSAAAVAPPPASAAGSAAVEAELAEARAALEAAASQRELDVQRTSAFWLDRLRAAQRQLDATRQELVYERLAAQAEFEGLEAEMAAEIFGEIEEALEVARPELGGAAGALAAGAAGGGASSAELTRLEEALYAAESELEELGETLDVQHETLQLSSARIGELGEALDGAAYAAELQLQRATAFWLDRLGQADRVAADAAAAALADDGEGGAVGEGGEDEAADVEAAVEAGSSSILAAKLVATRAELDVANAALEAADARREVDVQRMASFYLEKLAGEREAAGAK